MEQERQFPVMLTRGDGPFKASVPFALVKAHEKQALENHGQTVERLAERQGLSICELAAVLEDRPWHAMSWKDGVEAVERVLNRPDQQTV